MEVGENVMDILWVDKILHHFETMGSHSLLEFTRESNHFGVS